MRVLLVEDDAMNRKVVRDMLEVAGIEIQEASDGQAGLDLIARSVFDLLLLDLRMPGMDGLTAIRHVRTRGGACTDLPCIVVTADTRPSLRSECILAGADEVLLKPVAMQALFETIGRVMAARLGGDFLFKD